MGGEKKSKIPKDQPSVKKGWRMDSGTRNGRRTPRRVFTHPIGVLCRGIFEVVQAEQLSEGGVGFLAAADGQYLPKANVVISMILPGGAMVVTRGVILEPNIDSKHGRVAVKFSEMSLQLKRRIRNYVAAKTQEEAEAEAEDVALKKKDAA
jgi:hypothetical protein